MKAIIIEKTGGSNVLEYKETDKPQLAEGQVLVKVAAAPVNFIDTIIREGNMPPGMMPELPFISGVEGSGIVVDANNIETSNQMSPSCHTRYLIFHGTKKALFCFVSMEMTI